MVTLKSCVLVVLLFTVAFTYAQINRFSNTNLPGYTGQGPAVNMMSGYVTVRPAVNGNMFYTFVPSETPTDPLVLWLNGGPGCTSMYGALVESGPVRLTGDNRVEPNAQSWHTAAHMLYVDNPVGVGYSYVNGDVKKNAPNTAIDAAVDLNVFLTKFFELYAEYKQRDFYIFGESYGGKYAIALAQLLLKNKNTNGINLRGIGLGNAWVSPDLQERVYGTLGYTTGLINYKNLVDINANDKVCHGFIENEQFYDADKKACLPLWLSLVRSGGGFNGYDYRVMGRYPFITFLKNYLRSARTMQVMGVPATQIPTDSCNYDIFDSYLVEFQRDYTHILPELLKEIRVLVYNGQFDIRCSVRGTEEWLKVLNWEGKAGFNSLQHDVYYVNNVTSGIFRSYLNLTQVVVYGAGHLVPYDQPLTSLDMMIRFTRNRPFCSYNNDKFGTAPPNTCHTVACPNKCGGSSHGNCIFSSGKCSCAPGYTGEDCSQARLSLAYNRPYTTDDNFIFGKTFHAYYITLADYGTSFYNLNVQVVKKSSIGKAHIYAIVSDKQFVEPNEAFVDVMKKQYPFTNTEDIDSKTLTASNLDIMQGKFLTVIVYNNVDSDLSYSLKIWTEPPSSNVNGAVVVSTLLFTGLSGTAIVLLIIGIIQYTMNSQMQTTLMGGAAAAAAAAPASAVSSMGTRPVSLASQVDTRDD